MTFDGDNMEQLEELTEQAAEVVLDAGAVDVLVADTPAKKKDAWAARSSFLEAIEAAETKLLDECDVVVPVNQIAKYLTYVKGASGNMTSRSRASDMRVTVTYISIHARTIWTRRPSRNRFPSSWQTSTGRQQSWAVLISGEHGIGFGKKGYLAEFAGPVNMRLMRGIKETFDPKMILNPGKICHDPKEEA